MTSRTKTLLALTLLRLSISPAQTLAAATNIAAASDLKFALEELALPFEKQPGQTLTPTFGSSGTFATQIRHGAPFGQYTAVLLRAEDIHIFASHE